MQNLLEAANLPLFAANFDYFRLPPQKWALMLLRLKQMGTNIVTISMPWGFHEFKRGTFDLNGTTNSRRDVSRALNLCHQLDMPCLIGIGPYHRNGILNDGLPLWLSNDGDDPETGFTPAVEAWYTALSKTLTGRQWPDGPIVALEIITKASERQQPALTKQLTEVKWRIWLRKRYDGIAALNAAYGADYGTVNEVTFPQSWAEATTALEKDAQEFVEEVRREVGIRYTQSLREAGWHIPIYPPSAESPANLPLIQPYALAEIDELSSQELERKIFNLQQPIQVQPNPVDIGPTPAWATNAPIRADGSLRRSFWRIRQWIWSHTWPDTLISNGTVVATFDGISLVTCNSDTSLKLDVPTGPKPVIYRLRANGELMIEETFKIRRGKLTGLYLSEDEVDQTDLVFILTEPTSPFTGFPLTYLTSLLAGQIETLARGATLAERLAHMLTPPQDTPSPGAAQHPKQTLSTLEEARRGLREADTALRKAMSSIGGLEHGFATILDKNDAEAILQPVPIAVTITPEIFELPAREVLIEVGAVCAEIGPQLKSAVTTLEGILGAPENLTIEQYRQNWNDATTTAQSARQPLLDIISRLRLQLGSEELPLVLWRIHDQLQEIAETLRWGVLRR